jgi:hypothetical protein
VQSRVAVRAQRLKPATCQCFAPRFAPPLARLAPICPHRGDPLRRSFKICLLRTPTLSDASHREWRDLYARAQQEKNPERLAEICARARRAIHARQIQLASFRHIHDDEIGEPEAALRHLWKSKRRTGGRKVLPPRTHTDPIPESALSEAEGLALQERARTWGTRQSQPKVVAERRLLAFCASRQTEYNNRQHL